MLRIRNNDDGRILDVWASSQKPYEWYMNHPGGRKVYYSNAYYTLVDDDPWVKIEIKQSALGALNALAVQHWRHI